MDRNIIYYFKKELEYHDDYNFYKGRLKYLEFPTIELRNHFLHMLSCYETLILESAMNNYKEYLDNNF
jgi:hypothetical protein